MSLKMDEVAGKVDSILHYVHAYIYIYMCLLYNVIYYDITHYD